MQQDYDANYLRELQEKASGHKKLGKFKVLAWNWDSSRIYCTIATGHNNVYNVYSCKISRSKLSHKIDVDLNTVYKELRKALDHKQRETQQKQKKPSSNK